MEVTVDDNGVMVLSHVFSGIGIKTDQGMFGICQRDGGIEVIHAGKIVYSSPSTERVGHATDHAVGPAGPKDSPEHEVPKPDARQLWKEKVHAARDENDFISTKQILDWLEEASIFPDEVMAALLDESTATPDRLTNGLFIPRDRVNAVLSNLNRTKWDDSEYPALWILLNKLKVAAGRLDYAAKVAWEDLDPAPEPCSPIIEYAKKFEIGRYYKYDSAKGDSLYIVDRYFSRTGQGLRFIAETVVGDLKPVGIGPGYTDNWFEISKEEFQEASRK